MKHLCPSRPARGFTLVEMMVALALGMLIILAALRLLLDARATYADVDDAARVHETGRMALAHLGVMLRQAGHEETAGNSRRKPPSPSFALRGLDSPPPHAMPAPDQGHFGQHGHPGARGGDLLMLSVRGAPTASALVNCMGAAVSPDQPEWMFYAIREPNSKTSELHCHYRDSNGTWRRQALVEGVETMQIAYGVDTDTDGATDRWLAASAMREQDWRHVRLARVALVVRGAASGVTRDPPQTFELLGQPQLAPPHVSPADGRRTRAAFQTTVFLRNVASVP